MAAGSSGSVGTLALQVYDQLKADIYDFRLLPGDRFSEGELAARLEVSRTPIREALFRLQREGYVEVQFRSGWQVRPFDFAYFEDLYEVRIVIESAAINRLLDPNRSGPLEALESVWCVPVDARLTDADAVATLDEGFHTALVAATGNGEMARIHREVTERIRIIRRLDFTKASRIAATYEEHGAILTAIRAGRGDSAQALLRRHIEDSQSEVKRITLFMLQQARARFAS